MISFKCHEPELTAESSVDDAERYARETLELELSYLFCKRSWLPWRRLCAAREISRRLCTYSEYKRATGR